ncbi:MAG: AgmX/PglI C-terminal domain-containing protein [Pseudomonadota bacterium]
MTAYVISVPWADSREEKNFGRLLATFVGLTLVVALVVPWISLPEIPRELQEKLPPQLAEIVLARPEPPAVLPEPEPVPAVPEPEVVVEEVKPEVIEAPTPQTVRQAREKAAVSGLLAFRDDLADMRAAVDKSKLNDAAAIRQGSGEAASVDRSLLTSTRGGREASVNLADLSRETGGIALAGRETTLVEAPPEDDMLVTGAVRLVRTENVSVRSIEEVRRVFDANKGAIYAIYNRALRKNPGLLGKVVLELVIEPDGSVSDCQVLESELGDEETINKIVRRVQLFEFGEKNVAVTKISYPVHFLPT